MTTPVTGTPNPVETHTTYPSSLVESARPKEEESTEQDESDG
jgi:hypothetical protein